MKAILALLALVAVASGAEPVSVGGDFGQAWLKNLPYESTAASEDAGGLWSWGNTPNGYTVENGSLVPVANGTSQTDQTGIEWLGSEPPNASRVYFSPSGYTDYGYPFYSDDAWVLAQHYGIIVTTPLSYLPEDQQNDIRRALTA